MRSSFEFRRRWKKGNARAGRQWGWSSCNRRGGRAGPQAIARIIATWPGRYGWCASGYRLRSSGAGPAGAQARHHIRLHLGRAIRKANGGRPKARPRRGHRSSLGQTRVAMRVGNRDGGASIWRHREAPIGRGYLFTTVAAAAVRRLASVSDGDSPMTSAYICAKRPKCENPSSSATLVTLVSAVA
jgi:hypothetical protein